MSGRRSFARCLAVVTLGVSRISWVKLALRRALSLVVRFALRVRAHDYSPPPGSVTLVLAPHQDDETLGCGGLIARKRLDAQPVHVAFITDGAASHAGHPTVAPTELARRRADEARVALFRLGVETPAIHFLNAPDGRLAHLSATERDALVARLVTLLDTIAPDEVFLPFRRDGSTEHEAAFHIFELALHAARRRPRICEFPVWSWWNPLLLLAPLFRVRRVLRCRFRGYAFLKTSALSAYRSQTEPSPPWTSAILSPAFVALFSSDEEFFFEL